MLHLLASASALALTAAPARAEGKSGRGPCDALVDYLHEALAGPAPVVPGIVFDDRYRSRESRLEERLRSTSPTMPRAYTTRVTPACRAETRRGAAPEATEAARAWTQRPERAWIGRGRFLRCTMQDPAAFGELTWWITDGYHPEARAVCVSELATWPEAEPLRGKILARAVRRAPSWTTWEIDEAVVAAANAMGTPELREQLVPVLAIAHERHALGYDRLRAAVCANDGRMSDERARACSTLPVEAEEEWSQSERPNQWLARGAATGFYALAITTAAHDQAGGRGFTTGAGVLGGMAAGILVGAVAATALDYPRSESDENNLAFLIVGSALAGGVLGGVTAYELAASPGARAPVTAVALAPLYLTIVLHTFD